ncbi:MAG UNVERIFIED_CONTAM: hypothetical protein LVR18_42100 [Planctomycetaceae bacterium]|jgi:hypothetical protein
MVVIGNIPVHRKTDTTAPPIPSRAPFRHLDWITAELIQRTIEVWQPYYASVLTPEEAVTMIQAVGQLFQVLSSGSSS